MAATMGIGKLGDPTTIIKRKFRYDLAITPPNGITAIPTAFVKVANRPQLDIDELELQFLNASTWIPGKGRWQPLNITYIDTANSGGGNSTTGGNTASMQGFYDWIASVYDFQGYATSDNLKQTERAGWAATAIINMYDGCGSIVETWSLSGVWPQSVNFGDLDYGSPDECTIDLTIRFDKCQITKGDNCGITPKGKFITCGGGSA